MKNARELRQQRSKLLDKADAIVDAAEGEDRGLTDEETTEHKGYMDEAAQLEERAKRLEERAGRPSEPAPTPVTEPTTRQAPTIITNPGDNEPNAMKAFIRHGDMGGVSHIQDGENSIRLGPEKRASNDTTMNITTAGDGGDLVPTGHYNGIIARRDEMDLTNGLGVRSVPGVGTAVDVPVDNEDDGEFVSTAESGAYDRDAPAVTKVTLTLVKYTKKVDLTVELMEDEESRLLTFLEDFIGRGMAKTRNSLLLTEVAANGATLKTFSSATVIAVDELEPVTYNDNIAAYLDDSGSVAWVMKRSVHGEIVLLDDANVRRYADNQQGFQAGPSLLGFPVKYSQKSGATAASAKSLYFGNWNYVGMYEAPGFSIIRDPYTRAANGEVILNYMFRIDYGVLQSEAIGFGVHPSA